MNMESYPFCTQYLFVFLGYTNSYLIITVSLSILNVSMIYYIFIVLEK